MHAHQHQPAPQLTFTQHGQRRSQQRGVSHNQVTATLEWGQRYRQNQGRSIYYLGQRQVEKAAKAGEDVRGFERTAVVLSESGIVITVMRVDSPHRFRRRGRRRQGFRYERRN